MPQDNNVPSVRIVKIGLDYYVYTYENGRRTVEGPITSPLVARAVAVDRASRLGITFGA